MMFLIGVLFGVVFFLAGIALRHQARIAKVRRRACRRWGAALNEHRARGREAEGG